MQALIWGTAVGLCAVFAVAVFVATGRGRPVLPEPKAIPVSPEVATGSPTIPPPAGGVGPGVSLPPGPGATPATPTPAPAEPGRPQPVTEELFVEISAEMLVAADSFTDSDVGQRSFERACEGILQQHGVARADFEGLEAQIAADPERQARVVDLTLERADQLRHPTNVRVGPSPEGVVDPHRPPPRPPTPPR